MKIFIKHFVLILLLALPMFFSGCLIARPEPEKQESVLPVIYLLPLDGTSTATINRLTDYYKQKFNVKIDTLPIIPVEAQAIDTSRHQLIAEELIETIKRTYQSQLKHPKSIIIGVTADDMYIRQKVDWRFAFSFRNGDRYAVVAIARMNPVNLGDPPNEALMRTRLRKMITKNIGILFYNLPPNNNPKSVLYSGILGVDELDAIGEDF
jgi:predicted Zn-dependent protease